MLANVGVSLDGDRAIGHLKDGHYGCGCVMCKPWKHGKDRKKDRDEGV